MHSFCYFLSHYRVIIRAMYMVIQNFRPHPQKKQQDLVSKGWLDVKVQLIWKTFTKDRGLKVFHSFKIAFFEKFVLVWKEQGFSLFDPTYLHILLHCETNKDDKTINEPILESRLVSLIGSMKLFSKFRIYSDPDPLELPKSLKNDENSEF